MNTFLNCKLTCAKRSMTASAAWPLGAYSSEMFCVKRAGPAAQNPDPLRLLFVQKPVFQAEAVQSYDLCTTRQHDTRN